MGRDEQHDGTKVTGSTLALAGLAAAVIGFAAVYVTLKSADNVSSPSGSGTTAVAATAKPDPDAKETRKSGSPFAGFVRRSPPEALADVTFEDFAGKPVRLADFRGKAILLNLWATWCAPCRHEMPSLDRLQKDLGSDKFEVVALSLDRAGPDAARRFFDEIKVEHLKLYIDPTMRAGNALRAVGMPTTILIDAQGREVGRLPGPAEWDTAEAKALIADAVRLATSD